MAVEVNGIAHIQMTINNAEEGLPFWEKLCHFGIIPLVLAVSAVILAWS